MARVGGKTNDALKARITREFKTRSTWAIATYYPMRGKAVRIGSWDFATVEELRETLRVLEGIRDGKYIA